MNNRSTQRRETVYVFWGLMCSSALLYLAVRNADWTDMAGALRDVRFFPWLPAAVGAYVAATVFRGWRLRLIVSHQTDLTLATASNIVAVGYGANNLLPGRLGELARAYVLTDQSSVRYMQSLAVAVLERALDGAVMLALFAVSLYSVYASLNVPAVLSEAALVVLAGILVVVFALVSLAIVSAHSFSRGIAAAAGVLGKGAHEWGLRLGLQLASAFTYLRDPTGGAKVLVLSVLAWASETAMFLFVLGAFGLPLYFGWALFAMTVTNLGIMVPSSPGYVGPWHFFCSSALALLGVPASVGVPYAVVVHLAFYVPVTVWGMGVLLSLGLGRRSLIKLKRAAVPWGAIEPELIEFPRVASLPRQRVRTEAARDARFFAAIADAIMPEDDLPMDKQCRAAVRNSVADFVIAEVNCLSHRLRLMLSAGMLVFRLATRLRYIKGFCELPHERRAAWVARWSDGPFALTRKLFRPVRSLVLLAYYECPEVQAAMAAGCENNGMMRSGADR